MSKGLELKSFLAHLRLHYQFLILSGAFLSGSVFSGGLSKDRFLWQFLNVHILLFGGVTVYNSYFDRDRGPIGGMRHPTLLAKWTLPASWLMQFLGLGLSFAVSLGSGFIHALALLCFWCYSRPGRRWKGRPILGLFAIGIGTGISGFLLGYWQRGGMALSIPAVLGSVGVALLIVSLFPMSQIYQVQEDAERQDNTFTVQYGLAGVKNIFNRLFPLGVVLLALGLTSLDRPLGLVFLLLGSGAGMGIWKVMRHMRLSPEEYNRVMATKYLASGLLAVFLWVVLFFQARGFFAMTG